jgi:hypothetical protein
MRTEPTFEQRRAIQDEQQFYDALAVVDYLMLVHGDEAKALRAAQKEDERRAAMIGSDGGFWREVVKIMETSRDARGQE